MKTIPFKNLIQQCCAFLLIGLMWLTPISSIAGPGHDHAEESTPLAAATNSPRFSISSDLFEAVGIVKGKQIEIYVDHAKTNAPVEDAKLELEMNGQPVPVELHEAGEFDAVLPEALEHEEAPIAVALSIQSGSESAVLTGELKLHGDEEHHHADEDVHANLPEWVMYIGAAAALLVLTFAGARWNKRRKLRNQSQAFKG